MQNKSQRCEIKVGKFHLIIFWCFGVIEKNSQGGESPLPGIDRVNNITSGKY